MALLIKLVYAYLLSKIRYMHTLSLMTKGSSEGKRESYQMNWSDWLIPIRQSRNAVPSQLSSGG
jgi:hypothetical protein